MTTTNPIPPPIDAPDLSVTAKLVLNRLLGYHGKRGKVVQIRAAGMDSREASRAYQAAVRFLQENRGNSENARQAWEAWRDNQVVFKF